MGGGIVVKKLSNKGFYRVGEVDLGMMALGVEDSYVKILWYCRDWILVIDVVMGRWVVGFCF